MARAKKKDSEFPVSFGNVSIGDKAARIGVTVEREDLDIDRADAIFCGHRLTGIITAKAAGVHPDQGSLPGMEGNGESTLSGIFDVKGFSATTKAVSFGLTFNIEDIDVANLAHFAKRGGVLKVEHVEVLPDGDDSEE
jgi:hypothetical protein